MKNNDMKNDELAKKTENSVKLDFDAKKLAQSIERQLKEKPVLTVAELDELKAKEEAFGHEAAEKGCWIGLGSFRMEGREHPIALVHIDGAVSTLALLVADAMNRHPGFEQAILLAMGLKLKYGNMAVAAEDNEDEDYNEEEE